MIEYQGASVRRGELSFDNDERSKSVSIGRVNTSKAWLLFSISTESGRDSNIGGKMLRGTLQDGEELLFDRANRGPDLSLAWQLVEFTDGTVVRHGSQMLRAPEKTRSARLPGVDPSRSIASAGGFYHRGGRTPYRDDDNPGVTASMLDVAGATSLRITRGATGAPTQIGWFVVQFSGSGGGATEPVAAPAAEQPLRDDLDPDLEW